MLILQQKRRVTVLGMAYTGVENDSTNHNPGPELQVLELKFFFKYMMQNVVMDHHQ